MVPMSLTILIIAKLKHQLVASLSILPQSEAAFLDAIGEAIIGQGWRDEVESRSFAAILFYKQWQ